MTWLEIIECDSCAERAVGKNYEGMSRRDQVEQMYDLDSCAFLVTSPGPSAKVFKLTKDEASQIASSTQCAHVCVDCMNDLPVKLFDNTEIPEGALRD